MLNKAHAYMLGNVLFHFTSVFFKFALRLDYVYQ